MNRNYHDDRFFQEGVLAPVTAFAESGDDEAGPMDWLMGAASGAAAGAALGPVGMVAGAALGAGSVAAGAAQSGGGQPQQQRPQQRPQRPAARPAAPVRQAARPARGGDCGCGDLSRQIQRLTALVESLALSMQQPVADAPQEDADESYADRDFAAEIFGASESSDDEFLVEADSDVEPHPMTARMPASVL